MFNNIYSQVFVYSVLCLFELILLFILKAHPSHPTYCSVLVCKLTEQMYKTNSLWTLKSSPACYAKRLLINSCLSLITVMLFFCYKHFVYNWGHKVNCSFTRELCWLLSYSIVPLDHQVFKTLRPFVTRQKRTFNKCMVLWAYKSAHDSPMQ